MFVVVQQPIYYLFSFSTIDGVLFGIEMPMLYKIINTHTRTGHYTRIYTISSNNNVVYKTALCDIA